MAKHLITTSASTSGARSLPVARYLGFAVGPMSEHGVLRFKGIPGVDNLDVPAGSVIPVEAFSGAVIVEAISGLAAHGKIHAIGLTCEAELAVQLGPRAPARPYFEITKGAGVDSTASFAFAGRRHAMVDVVSDAVSSCLVYGWLDFDSRMTVTEARTLLGTFAIAAGKTAFHIGGTNEAEPWDQIDLVFSHANAAVIDVQAVVGGEFGR